MHVNNFVVCGPKFTVFFYSNVGGVVVDQLLFRNISPPGTHRSGRPNNIQTYNLNKGATIILATDNLLIGNSCIKRVDPHFSLFAFRKPFIKQQSSFVIIPVLNHVKRFKTLKYKTLRKYTI